MILILNKKDVPSKYHNQLYTDPNIVRYIRKFEIQPDLLALVDVIIFTDGKFSRVIGSRDERIRLD